jgi:hypothetical protein
MEKKLRAILLFIGIFCIVLAPAKAQDADHILLTEIIVTPTEGEAIEIFNPTSSSVDLSDYYLYDATFAGNDQYYYNIVNDGATGGGGTFFDFHARFPDGAMIGPGEYQTVALDGSDAFSSVYGVEPTYELAEDASSADGIPDMREATSGSISDLGRGLTNSGEVVVLYTWDGSSDLVQDVDYVVWGDKAEAISKDGVSTDGPDQDTNSSSYNAETSIENQEVLGMDGHESGNSFQRQDLTEGAETSSGGNGITGNDEMSEDFSNTWVESPVTVNNPLPVELATFDGQATGSGIALRWQTLSETNNAGFDVLHRAPRATDFANAGFVSGNGTISETSTYDFFVATEATGTHTFRLRQVDVDGAETLSDPIDVTIGARQPLTVVGPNPARPGADLAVTVRVEATQKVDVGVYNVLGQRVASVFSGSVAPGTDLRRSVDVSTLPSGLYFIRAMGETLQATEKISVVR